MGWYERCESGDWKKRERAKEGVAVLLNENVWQEMVEYKQVNSRMIWVKVSMGGSL